MKNSKRENKAAFETKTAKSLSFKSWKLRSRTKKKLFKYHAKPEARLASD